MKPTHPVELIVYAIATQENNPATNPGNLRYAGQIGATCPRCMACGKVPAKCIIGSGAAFDSHAVAIFVDRLHGIAALFRQVWAQVASGEAIPQLIAAFAPPNENNTAAYIQNVLYWTQLRPDIPVLQMLPQPIMLNAPSTHL